MNYSDIIESIRNKDFHPIYLLHGEEPYFINEIGIVIEVTEGNLSDFVYRIKTSYSLVVTSTVQDIEVINKA